MKYAARILAAALLAASALVPVEAAQFTHGPNGHLFITGSIDRGDDARFAAALDNDVRVISLTSYGGYVSEAMAIGRLIRARGLNTEVPAQYQCFSACTLVWAGGAKRTVDGALAFHCPHAPNEMSCNQVARESMIAYLREMGVSERLVVLQEAAGPTSAIWARQEDLAAEAAGATSQPVPAPKARPVVVADGRYSESKYLGEPPPPPPPRRYVRPPPYAPYPPPPPPGWLYGPGGRLIPCALGLLGICI